jgi:hypothetical protein
VKQLAGQMNTRKKERREGGKEGRKEDEFEVTRD